MGEQHLNLFPAATSSLIFRRRRESPGDVAGVFVQITRVNRLPNLTPDRRPKLTPPEPVLFCVLEGFPEPGRRAYSVVRWRDYSVVPTGIISGDARRRGPG